MFYFAQTVFKKGVIRGLALILALMIWIGALIGAGASPAAAGRLEEYQHRSKALDERIKAKQAEVNQLKKKADSALDALNQTDQAIAAERKKLQRFQQALDRVRADMKKNRSRQAALQADIKGLKADLGKRLAALYKLHRLGRIHLLASAGSIHDYFQRKRFLETILAHDRQLLARLGEKQAQLETTLAELEKQRQKQTELKEKYQAQVRTLAARRTDRQKLLAKIRKEKSLTISAIRSLKAAAKALDQKIAALQKGSGFSAPGKKSFAGNKGLLNMPVQGKIMGFFGPYKNPRYNVQNFRSGIDIQAERGQVVRAVLAGKVIFADWFKGYGNMLIVDHGHHYCTVYAHAEELRKTVGERVQAGEIIATVGDTGSMIGPGLHFEVRHHGKALNPMKWLKKDS